MRNYTYIVTFETGLMEEVNAGDPPSARIMAQARQIEKGNQYKVASIRKLPTQKGN
ncbi:unnamed protein product [marine sediment metagenome]|uniref:Uncharacterized protein n=1 Tax=marine sediment metagenome TaxID=412755 RepID=X0U429_9ZZZZ